MPLKPNNDWTERARMFSIKTRFKQSVVIGTEANQCWQWTSHKTSDGRALMSIGPRNVAAGRVSFFLAHGFLTDELLLHTCDNGECTNPLHLRLGSHAENMQEAWDRNRRGKRKLVPTQRYVLIKPHDADFESYVNVVVKRFFYERALPASDNSCWDWAGKLDGGYPSMRVFGKTIGAHRVSLWLATGERSNGRHVLHSCDNPKCTNPQHLRFGTHSDNISEMHSRNRHPWAKLTTERVRAIRQESSDGENSKELAAKYGVSYATIRLIVRRKIWKQEYPCRTISLES